MSYIRRVTMAVTATSSAGATFFSPVLSGHLESFAYRRGASGFATTAHLAVVTENSSVAIWDGTCTGDFTAYPRALANGSASGQLGFSSVHVGIPVQVPIGQERLRFTFSSMTGGSAGVQARIHLYISGAEG
jgi:hypothetical protein